MSVSDVPVNLIVSIDLSNWSNEYGLDTRVETVADLTRAAELVLRDWLRETVGFKNADVRAAR